MAELIRVGAEIVVHMSRLERIGSLHVDVRVPIASVKAVRAVPDGLAELRGIRAPGTGVPGMLMLGTTRHSTGKDFCAVRGHGSAVMIDLEGEVFSRILVSDSAADQTVERLDLA